MALIPFCAQDDDEEIRQVTSAAVSAAGAPAVPFSSGLSFAEDVNLCAGSSEVDGKKSVSVSAPVSGASVPFYISVVQVWSMHLLSLRNILSHSLSRVLTPNRVRSMN